MESTIYTSTLMLVSLYRANKRILILYVYIDIMTSVYTNIRNNLAVLFITKINALDKVEYLLRIPRNTIHRYSTT